MKKIVFLVLIFHHFIGVGQDTFIKEMNANFSGEASIVATNDNGWLIFSEESLQLTKYNQCGDFEWSKTYDVNNQSCCIGTQIVLGTLGEAYLLSRQTNLPNSGFSITCVSATGFVLWNKSYSDVNLEYYPYSLMIDALGDLLIFANTSPIGGGNGYSTLTKMDVNGNIKWSKRYDNGGTWGEAIVTQDTGVLIRRGDSFLKLDTAGLVEWATRVSSTNTYYYRAPVEVSDGYIFTKKISGSEEIGFYKIDKQGDLHWGGGQFSTYRGNPNSLRNTPNGNFTAIFNVNTGSSLASSIIMEFDKDLNVVKENAISLGTPDWFFNDLCFSKSNEPLVVGGSVSLISQHFVFGKLDQDYKVGCDTVINTTFTLNPATFSSESVVVSVNPITSVFVVINATDVTILDLLTCSDTKVRVVALAKDTVICPDTSLILQNLTSDSFTNYLWSTGETTSTIEVNTSGKYWVECATPCVSTTYSDTIVVEVTEIQDPNLSTDTVLCGANTILLNAEIPLGQYLWQDNSILPTYLVTEPGNFYVDITFNNCVKRFESKILDCEDFLIPNIFTPNGDGINDYFQVVYDGNKPFECQIFNRWGILQFETNTARFQWDGTVGGVAASDGVYVYLIKIGDKKIKGTITLVH